MHAFWLSNFTCLKEHEAFHCGILTNENRNGEIGQCSVPIMAHSTALKNNVIEDDLMSWRKLTKDA